MNKDKTFRHLKLEAAKAALQHARSHSMAGTFPNSRAAGSIAGQAREKPTEQLTIDSEEEIEQIVELSDRYAFRAIVLWLAGSLSSIAEEALSSLEEYPFGDESNSDQFKQFKAGAAAILSSTTAAADVELLGDYYEHVQKFPLYYDQAQRLFRDQNRESKSSRRAGGQFFTPKEVVDYCWQKTLVSCSVSSSLASSAIAPLFRLPASPCVLDPSCGTGNFLVGFLRQIKDRVTDKELAQIVASGLHGMDIDGKAVCLCRIAIVLTLIRHCPDLFAGSTARGTARIRQIVADLRHNIKVCDALLACPDLLPSQATSSTSKKFDFVITNPPYVSFGARNQAQLPASAAMLLRTMFPDASEYKVRLHSIFQDLALRYLKPSGIATLLVPDGFLTGSYYGRLRKLLLQQCRIRSVSELPPDTISGAVVGRWCVAVYEKSDSSCDYPVEVSSAMTQPERKYRLQKSVFVSPQMRFRIILNQLEEEICHLTDALPLLSSVLRGHTGMRALHGQASICADRQLSASWRKGLRSGSAVTPYLVQWDQTWLHVEKSLLYAGGFDPEVIGNPKILVRQTGDRITAAVDLSGLYHLNNLHSLRLLDPSLNLHLITALLNSSLWLFLYRLKTREHGRAMAQIDIETLASMPLPHRNLETEAAISDLSRTLSTAGENWRAGKRRADGASNSWRGDLKSAAIVRAIDRLVYDLYRLNEAFVEHIESDCGKLTPHYEQLASAEETAMLVQGIRVKRSASPQMG